MQNYSPLSLLRRLAVAFAIGGFGAYSLAHAQAPALTASDIEMLLSVKMADDVIVAKARRSGKPVDLTTQELIGLKKAGASDSLIRQLFSIPATSNPSQLSAVTASSSTEAKMELGVYAKKGEAWVEIASEIVNVKSSGLLKAYTFRMDMNGRINGTSSKTTLKTPIEIMLVTPEGVNANEYPLVKLRPKDTFREFRVASSGFGGGKTGVDRDAVAYDFKKIGPGQFTINLPSAVVAGEYAFLPPMGGGGAGSPAASMGKAYTFRVLE